MQDRYLDENRVNINIKDYSNERFELPLKDLYTDYKSFEPTSGFKKQDSNLKVSIYQQQNQQELSEEQTFAITIERKNKLFAEKMIDTQVKSVNNMTFDQAFYYGEKYIQFSTKVNFKEYKLYGLQSEDINTQNNLEMVTDRQQSYVVWDNMNEVPFIIFFNKENRTSHGLFLMTSNPTEIEVNPKAGRLIFKILGDGIFNLYIYNGPTLKEVISQHYSTIGRSQLPPYYALGYQQSKDGYRLTDIHKITEGFIYNQIPIDIFWNYLDYLKSEPFQIDTDSFNEMVFREQIRNIHAKNIKYGLCILPGLQIQTLEKQKQYVLIDQSGQTNLLKAQLVDNKISSTIPNYLNEATQTRWKKEIRDMLAKLGIDSMWLDKNQPYSRTYQLTSQKKSHSYMFVPGNIDLQENTIPIEAYVQQDIETKQSQYLNQLNIHQLFKVYQSKNTYDAFFSLQGVQRPFILSSTYFPGQNQYTSRFFIVTETSWNSMRQTFIKTIRHQLVGELISGGSVCGQTGQIEEDLCIRWHQMTALTSPIMRNHYSKQNQQEPYAITMSATPYLREIIELRYSLLSYMYTCIVEGIEKGEPLARQMIYEYSNEKSRDGTDIFKLDQSQFMLGPNLLISPIMEQGIEFTNQKRHHTVYFPNETYYHFLNGSRIKEKGQTLDIHIDLISQIPIYIRGGTITTFQNVTKYNSNQNLNQRDDKVLNTYDLKNKLGVDLLIALNESGYAEGYYILDDGQSTQDKKEYNKYNLQIGLKDSDKLEFKISKIANGYDQGIEGANDIIKYNFKNLVIYGYQDIVGTKELSLYSVQINNEAENSIENYKVKQQLKENGIMEISNLLDKFSLKNKEFVATFKILP